jgi:AcrR family transcriptional regulator
VRSVSAVTSATVPATDPIGDPASVVVDAWATEYLTADDAERRLVDAALACIARWGIRKTSLDDIARQAGVSRATVYRVFPGGKERLVEVVVCHEAGRIFHAMHADLDAAGTLEELVVTGVTSMLRLLTDNDVLQAVIRHEPELVLPHFAFHQLGRVLDLAEALCRPHLERFLPAADVRPAAELLARVVLTFGFRPAAWVDPHDPASIRRLVGLYLLPALTTSPTTPAWETT